MDNQLVEKIQQESSVSRLKTVFVNITVGVALFGSVLLLGALFQDAKRLLPERDDRSELAVYADIPWAAQHFREFRAQETRYADFIGWRRKPFQGQTITVNEDGYRVVPGQSEDPGLADIHVFGGSTVWGTGSDNTSTFPAQLAAAAASATFNFGESGYTSHQSLNLLLKNYATGLRPRVVIFYDGVNDVSLKCRSEISFFATAEEYRLKNLTSESRLWRLVSVGLGIAGYAGTQDPFDCDTNPEKARRVADMLVMDWVTAQLLAKSHGAKFIPILQPVSYIGNPKTGHLPKINERLKRQYEVMYPLIRERLSAAGFAYHDFTDLFDIQQEVYIDFCHVTPLGNTLIAARVAELLKGGID